jgi:cytochrome c
MKIVTSSAIFALKDGVSRCQTGAADPADGRRNRSAYTCCHAARKPAISAPQRAARANPDRDISAMDSFEFNKIIGAVLFTGLCLLALNITAEAIFAPHHPAKPGFEIEIKKEAASGPAEKAAAEEPIEKLLASATVERGQNVTKVCQSCHTFQKGGANGQGPNLYGVVGRPRASEPSFMYSDAMKAKGGDWTIDDLNKFLTNPKEFVPGTKMNFPGLPRGNQRADAIAYLNSLADSPKPLPVAKQ